MLAVAPLLFCSCQQLSEQLSAVGFPVQGHCCTGAAGGWSCRTWLCALQSCLLQGGSTLCPAVLGSDRLMGLQLGSPKPGLFSTRHRAVVQYSKEQLEMRGENVAVGM